MDVVAVPRYGVCQSATTDVFSSNAIFFGIAKFVVKYICNDVDDKLTVKSLI